MRNSHWRNDETAGPLWPLAATRALLKVTVRTTGDKVSFADGWVETCVGKEALMRDLAEDFNRSTPPDTARADSVCATRDAASFPSQRAMNGPVGGAERVDFDRITAAIRNSHGQTKYEVCRTCRARVTMKPEQPCFHKGAHPHTTCKTTVPLAHYSVGNNTVAAGNDIQVALGGIAPTNKSREQLTTWCKKLASKDMSEAEAKQFGLKLRDKVGGSYRAQQLLLHGLETHTVAQGPFHLLGVWQQHAPARSLRLTVALCVSLTPTRLPLPPHQGPRAKGCLSCCTRLRRRTACSPSS